jgi:putative RecB family exonuclease
MTIYSYSKLSTYEKCSLKFKFKYIDKIEPEFEQSIEGFLGKEVHKSLEWLYSKISKGVFAELDELIEFYISSWNKNFNENLMQVNKTYLPEHYFNKGIKFLVDYFLLNFPFRDNTIALEKKILIDLDKEGLYQIVGYIDRLVYDPKEKFYEIHDYKTTDFIKTKQELEKDKQLLLYSLGIKEHFKEVNEIYLVWHFLSQNRQIRLKTTLEGLEKLKEEVIELIKKIENTKEFTPNKTTLCNWCEYKNYCTKLNPN